MKIVFPNIVQWHLSSHLPTSQFAQDKKGQDQMRKNPNIKIKPFDDLAQVFTKTELEASAELAKRLEAIIHTTFDQYEGLRQINDFRRYLASSFSFLSQRDGKAYFTKERAKQENQKKLAEGSFQIFG